MKMRVRLGSVGDLGESMVRPESEVRVDSIENNGVVLEELREQDAAEFRENVDVENAHASRCRIKWHPKSPPAAKPQLPTRFPHRGDAWR